MAYSDVHLIDTTANRVLLHCFSRGNMANSSNQTTLLPPDINTSPSNESPASIFWTTTLHILTSSALNITNSSASDVIPNITVLKRPFCTEPGELLVWNEINRSKKKLLYISDHFPYFFQELENEHAGNYWKFVSLLKCNYIYKQSHAVQFYWSASTTFEKGEIYCLSYNTQHPSSF